MSEQYLNSPFIAFNSLFLYRHTIRLYLFRNIHVKFLLAIILVKQDLIKVGNLFEIERNWIFKNIFGVTILTR